MNWSKLYSLKNLEIVKILCQTKRLSIVKTKKQYILLRLSKRKYEVKNKLFLIRSKNLISLFRTWRGGLTDKETLRLIDSSNTNKEFKELLEAIAYNPVPKFPKDGSYWLCYDGDYDTSLTALIYNKRIRVGGEDEWNTPEEFRDNHFYTKLEFFPIEFKKPN